MLVTVDSYRHRILRGFVNGDVFLTVTVFSDENAVTAPVLLKLALYACVMPVRARDAFSCWAHTVFLDTSKAIAHKN